MRALRLYALALVLVGSVSTALVLAGVDLSGSDPGAGSLVFPLAAIAGIVGLVYLRPRKRPVAPDRDRGPLDPKEW